jgi:hypothetical protein
MMGPLRIPCGRRARTTRRVRFVFRVRSPANQPLQFCLDRASDGVGVGQDFLALAHQAQQFTRFR